MARSSGRRRTILAFGESHTDTHALKELVAALRPDLPVVAPRRQPIILARTAARPKKATVADRIENVVRAEQVQAEVIAVLAQRDLDACDPRDSAAEPLPSEEDLRASLSAVAKCGPIVVTIVTAWEMEAWWFLWPRQVAAHRPGWRKLHDRSGQRVDRIDNAKEALVRALRPSGRVRVPDYSETDGPHIAAGVREAGAVRTPMGRSLAYEAFVTAIDGLPA